MACKCKICISKILFNLQLIREPIMLKPVQRDIYIRIKLPDTSHSPVVKALLLKKNAGSILGQGTRSHMLRGMAKKVLKKKFYLVQKLRSTSRHQ